MHVRRGTSEVSVLAGRGPSWIVRVLRTGWFSYVGRPRIAVTAFLPLPHRPSHLLEPRDLDETPPEL